MARAYSDDLRRRVLSALAGGSTVRATARRFEVAPATVSTWAKHLDAGRTGPLQQGRVPGSRLDEHGEFIDELLERVPRPTLKQMVEELRARRRVAISPSRLCSWLLRHGRRAAK